MHKCIFGMVLAVGYITGCGDGFSVPENGDAGEASSNAELELAQANSASEESSSETAVEPTSSLEGVWQTTYPQTLLNDAVGSSDCVEVTSFYRDYTWYRISLNNISSGFYTVVSEATDESRGMVTLTATFNNELASCNDITDIQVGAETTRFFDEPTDEGTSFYSKSDLSAEPIGIMIKDEVATAALLDPASFDSSVMDSIDETSGYQQALATLFERQDRTYPPEPSIETLRAPDTGSDTSETEVTTDSEATSEPQITTEPEATSEPQVTTEPEATSEPQVNPEIDVPEVATPETSPELPIVVVTEPEFVSQIEAFSVSLRCSHCQVEEIQLSWESETNGLEKLELLFDNDDIRTVLATLDRNDYSALNVISSSLDLIEHGSGCFEVVSTTEEGSTSSSPQTCLGIHEVN